MANQDVLPVVLDLGSNNIRAGFGGDDAPRAMFPSILGVPKQKLQTMVMTGAQDSYVGDEAQAKRGICAIRHPIVRGVTQNWGDMEQLLHHTFYSELRVAGEEPVLFSVPVMSPLAQQEKMTQILMETFGVPACAGVLGPALSMYASGRGTGIVVEIGAGVTQIVPIYESKIIDEAIIRRDFGGDDLTNYMATMMTERTPGTASLPSGLLEEVDTLKQRCCYVAADFEAELHEFASSSAKDMVFSFADGTQHRMGAERIRTGEAFFKPALLGVEMQGLHKSVYEAVLRSPMDTRRDFYGNIILSGGPTMMNGFSERLSDEITSLAPAPMRTKIVSPPERKYSTWIGGSIVSSLQTFHSLWLSREAYEEEGARGIHSRGCLHTSLHHHY